MVRVLLDTCIYGNLIIDKEGIIIAEKIIKNDIFIVHDFTLIRKELRNTPRKKRIKSKNLKINLINLYDKIVQGKTINEDNHIQNLADGYFKEYRKLGGGISKRKLYNDFKIVACASIKKMDIISSDDKGSLCSDKSLKAYDIVNIKNNLRTPRFINYKTLKLAVN